MHAVPSPVTRPSAALSPLFVTRTSHDTSFFGEFTEIYIIRGLTCWSTRHILLFVKTQSSQDRTPTTGTPHCQRPRPLQFTLFFEAQASPATRQTDLSVRSQPPPWRTRCRRRSMPLSPRRTASTRSVCLFIHLILLVVLAEWLLTATGQTPLRRCSQVRLLRLLQHQEED